MAFFSDSCNAHYLSLSLSPTGASKAYVFALTPTQYHVAYKTLPVIFAISLLTLAAVSAIGVLDLCGLSARLASGDQQTAGLLSLNAVNAVMVFIEWAYFIWARFRPAARLADSQRRKLQDMTLDPKRSLMAYGTYLAAIATPPLAYLALPGGIAGIAEEVKTSDLLTRVFALQVLAAATLLVILIVRRIYAIARLQRIEKDCLQKT